MDDTLEHNAYHNKPISDFKHNNYNLSGINNYDNIQIFKLIIAKDCTATPGF